MDGFGSSVYNSQSFFSDYFGNGFYVNLEFDFASLSGLAFHRELVQSRRLAQRDHLSPETALMQVLTQSAGDKGLTVLLDQRRQQKLRQAEIKNEKRHLAQQKFQQKIASRVVPSSSWCGWFDGSARPNPGACAIGVVLQAPDGQQWTLSRAIGYGTSSTAEYQALTALLELAISHGSCDIHIYGDSRVVIDDLYAHTSSGTSSYLAQSVPSLVSTLAPMRSAALALMEQIAGVHLHWIPRARNQQADALAQRGFAINP